MPNYNKTKIIATIGPSCDTYEKLSELFESGADVCRLNFSHGDHENHARIIQHIRDYNHANHANICTLLDLQGPKLRIGEAENGAIFLETGALITVTTEKCISTSDILYVSYQGLPGDVHPGERILLDDGKIKLEVLETDGKTKLKAKIIYGGKLSSKKGFNLPDTKTSMPSLTPKDLLDLEFGLKHHVEWIALSFVRKPEDILELREKIKESGKTTRIVAKIEKPEAVVCFDEILKVADAVMVARGDLGVELPAEEVPVIQKTIVERCINASKPVIIATQMMESMIQNPTPTRAEVNDVANAVFDGADALMLSAETSVGSYPIGAVSMMQKIIAQVEMQQSVYFKGKKPIPESPTFLSDEICFTACRMSDHLHAKAIIGMTYSGYTAFKISSFRPLADIFIFTSNIPLLNTLGLVWGVRGYYYNKYESTDHTFRDQQNILKFRGVVEEGDIVIHTASMPIEDRARTNTIKVSIINDQDI